LPSIGRHGNFRVENAQNGKLLIVFNMSQYDLSTVSEESHVLVFHGTTDKALDAILESGEISCEENKIWNCSSDCVYFWNPEVLMELEGLEDLEEAQTWARDRAIENATCSFALDRKSKGVAIISFWVKREDIQDDKSCQNMLGAGCINKNISIDLFEKIEVSTSDVSFYRPFLAKQIMDNEFIGDFPYSDEEKNFIKSITDYYASVNEMIDFEQIDF
jgi:hypothetical protein